MTPNWPDPRDKRETTLEEFAARVGLARRRERLDLATVEACEALDAAEIPVLLLKGAAIAEALYAPDRHRSYFDIDLLVAPSQHEEAGRVLARLGYRNMSEARGVEDVGDILHATMWSRVDEELGNLITVDLHWRLHGARADADEVWDALWRATDEVTVAGRVLPRLDNAGLAMHAALHVAQHGPDDHKAATDLKLALERWPPSTWRTAKALADALQASEMFAAGLHSVPEGRDIAHLLGLDEVEPLLWDIEHRDDRPRGTVHLAALAEATTWSGRMRVIRRALFPSRAWITWEYRWAGRSRLQLAMGYALHLLRTPAWAWRAARFLASRPR